jgi:flavin-dependent dehydrogenase
VRRVETLTFDVLIVGAGPAGCAAAIRAASHGLSVALLEKLRFPRHVPGEALHPDVQPLFDQLGLTETISNAGFIRYPGWILTRDSESTFVPFGNKSRLRFGYQAWRSELDSILLAQAQRAGADVFQRDGRVDLILSGDRIVGLNVTDRPLSCRYLVDASGTTRWLSRKMRLEVTRLSPQLVAEYGYVTGDSHLGILPEFHEHACGWTWLARVTSDCCQCVRLSLDAAIETPPLPEPFDGVRLRGANVTWRLVQECAGPGYFLCGDAAATLDPAASSGVARAMAAGIKAADLIAGVQASTMSESDAVHVYRDWVGREVAAQAVQLASRYAGLETPPSWLGTFNKHVGTIASFKAFEPV